jgi:hypothetical protein
VQICTRFSLRAPGGWHFSHARALYELRLM